MVGIGVRICSFCANPHYSGSLEIKSKVYLDVDEMHKNISTAIVRHIWGANHNKKIEQIMEEEKKQI